MKIPQNKKYIMFGGTFALANKLQVIADKRMTGLSTKQWFLLRNLSDFSSNAWPTMTELAKETDTSRQNVSKMLEVLKRQGYVELQNNVEDHRSQVVVLTESGCNILRQVAQEAQPFFDELFLDIPEEEYLVAAKVVIKMMANLNCMQKDIDS